MKVQRGLYRGEIDPDTTRNWGKPDVDLVPDGKTICLILEGAYPYVAGGVSSWIQQLITKLPHYRFKILTIMAADDEDVKIKYKFPENVIEFRTVFLYDFFNVKQERFRKKISLTQVEREQLRKFILFDTSVDWSILTNLICRQDKIGNTVDFLMSFDFFDELEVLYNKKYQGEGFNIFFWTFRSMLATLICVMQQRLPEADLYHAISTGYAGLLGLIAKYTYNSHFLLTEHGVYAREREEEILKADWVKGVYKKLWIDYFYFLSIGAYVSAEKSVALFTSNSEIQQSLGVPKNRALVIPNGVDDTAFPKHKDEHPGVHIGAILRIVPIKDVKTLIRAFKFVLSACPDTLLYLIGPAEEDKQYSRECELLIDELGMKEQIIFTGRVDVRQFMPNIDIVVLTSISEAQPLVILEAYAASTPVVATDVGSCRELVEGINDGFGPGGIITKPVTPRETADALLTLIRDPEKRRVYGDNGLQRAKKLYSNTKVFRTYDNLYRDIIEGEEY